MAQISPASQRVSLWPWVYILTVVYFACTSLPLLDTVISAMPCDRFFEPQYGLPKAISGHQNWR